MTRAALAVVLLAAMGCSSPRAQAVPPARPGAGDQTTGTSGQAKGQVKGKPDLTPKEAARIPPMPPTDVQVKTEGNKTVVSWKPSRLKSVTSYKVYRKLADGRVTPIAEVEEPRFVDQNPPKGPATYCVASVSRAGTESSLSEPAVKIPRTKDPAK